MPMNPFTSSSSNPGSTYATIGSAAGSGSDSDDDARRNNDHRRRTTKKKSGSSSYDISNTNKPSVSALSRSLSRSNTTLRCHTVLLFLLAVALSISTLSQQRSLHSTQSQQDVAINSLNSQVTKIEHSLDETVQSLSKSLSKFNRTVTNAELLDEVKVLHSQVDSQLAEVRTVVKKQNAHITAELHDTTAKIDSDLAAAQSRIDKDISTVSGTLSDYQSRTSEQFSLENNFMLFQLAGTFTLIGGLISIYHVSSHLRNFHNPVVQRKVSAKLTFSTPSLQNRLATLGLCFASLARAFRARFLCLLRRGSS